MSWTDYYRRRDAIERVLAQASCDPAPGLPFANLPEVTEAFASREELALALQYKWTQLLSGRINVALIDAERSPDADHVEAVAAAWRTTASKHSTLRAVLDAYAVEDDARFHAALRAEQRTLALAAGLAEPSESSQEITQIGAAFQALIRTQQPKAPRRNPIEQLFRRLVASA